MPIPKPEENETKKEFMDRCMADPTMINEYDDKQRLAICSAQMERNIKIITGSPCSGKNTYVEKHKRKGDIVWDFDKVHTALTGEASHNHIENVRKYIFSMRDTFYKDIKKEKNIRVWIINSSPLKEVRQKLAEELGAEIIFIKRSKNECLKVAQNERPSQWENYINSYFERLESPTDDENIKIIEVKTMGKTNENMERTIYTRHIKEIIEDEDTITIVYGKSDKFEGIKVDQMVEQNDGHLEEEIEEEEEEQLEEDENMEENDGHLDDEEDEDEDDPVRRPGYRSSFGKVDVWDKKHTQEKRYFDIESRLTKDKGKDVVVGHAAVFNSLSEDLGGFREKIMPGAFDDVLKNDVRAYFNHDPNYLLGRTSAGTLRLSVDEKGLRYELDVPNTTAGRDLKENLRLGNITQSSFAFTIGRDGDSWERNEDGADIRIINKVNRLYDVSPVSLPAYPSANDLALAQRSNFLDKEKTRKKNEQEYETNSLLNLKINLLKRK